MKNHFLIISFVLIFLTSSIVGITSNVLIRDMHEKEIYNSLVNTAYVAKSFLENSDSSPASLFKVAAIFGKNNNQRLTIYSNDGFAIADSKNNSVILSKKSILHEYDSFIKNRKYFILSKDFEEGKIVIKIYTEIISNKSGKQYFIGVSENLESFNYFQKNIFFILLVSILISLLISIPCSIFFNNKEIKIIKKTFDSMEKELDDRMHNLEIIIENMSEGLILLSSDKLIIDINSFAKSILNFNNNRLFFYDYKILKELEEIVEVSFNQMKNMSIELEFEKRFYKCSTFCVEGNNSRVILMLEDISKAKKLDISKKEFVSNASHELKTPLTIISGFLETIMLKNYNDERQLFYYLDIVQNEVNRLKKLVTNLLSLSIIENNYMKSNKINLFKIDDFILKLEGTFDFLAQEKNIKLNFNYKNESMYILFPKEWLEIIISNILDNAIKYSTKNKNVNINLDIIHNTLIIEIQDFGMGIKEEDFTKIFERFYRGDKSHSSTIEGTGLGLSIVKHMIDIIEGEITVKSRINEGTTFSIYIPIIEMLKVD